MKKRKNTAVKRKSVYAKNTSEKDLNMIWHHMSMGRYNFVHDAKGRLKKIILY